MSKIKAAITGVAGYVPPYVLTNKELETMVETSDEWISSMTGIKERRILKDGKATSDMGAEIVKDLLAKTNTSPDEIEMIICATVTADMVFPDTANTIADKCGITNAFGYDINAACSGFLYALNTGAMHIETGRYKKVIILGIDMMSSIIDYTDRTTCIIFGDGGGGVLLEPSTEYGVEDAILKSDGSGRNYLHMKSGGSLSPASAETVAAREHFVYQEGRTVFKAAVTGMTTTLTQLLDKHKLTHKDVTWLVPHQANMRIIDSVANMIDFPKEKVMINIEKYGNTTAGTLPLCLSDYESQLRPGDKIMLTAFGGGFTWGTLYLTWAYDGSKVDISGQ